MVCVLPGQSGRRRDGGVVPFHELGDGRHGHASHGPLHVSCTHTARQVGSSSCTTSYAKLRRGARRCAPTAWRTAVLAADAAFDAHAPASHRTAMRAPALASVALSGRARTARPRSFLWRSRRACGAIDATCVASGELTTSGSSGGERVSRPLNREERRWWASRRRSGSLASFAGGVRAASGARPPQVTAERRQPCRRHHPYPSAPLA